MLQQILQSKRLLQPWDPAVPPLGNHSHLGHARDHHINRDKVLHQLVKEEAAVEAGRVRKASDLARPQQVPEQVEFDGPIRFCASFRVA
jgi:hypothetical protein